MIRQITREYKCIKENLLMYFAMATQLLDCFEVASITHKPRMENQEANELAQISSRYKLSKEKLKGFIEVKEKMVLNISPSPNMAISKNGGQRSSTINFLKILKILQGMKFLPLIICRN